MQNWHTYDTDEVVRQLETNASTGLTAVESVRRLAVYGPNELQAATPVSKWSILLEQFRNILILILLIAAAVSAFLGHDTEAIVIVVIMLFTVLLGFMQEYRAERALDALHRMAAPVALVVRNGEQTLIPARDLVPGDLVILQTGNRVPADVRLIECVNLRLDEAALTGESFPVEKQTGALDCPDMAVSDRGNMAHAGTAVSYGRGRGIVVATGMQTEFGKIARMLEAVEVCRTPLQKNLDRVGRILAWSALAVVALIVVLGLLRGQPLLEMFIFGIALAVAVVPEALPAVVTISLAIGVQRMVRRNALIRRLPAVETLGSTSVICSDKTGTLTKDEMTVRRIYVAGEMWRVSGEGYDPHGTFDRGSDSVPPSEPLKLLLRAAALASDAHVARDEKAGRWCVKGDPTEGALVVAATKAGMDKIALDEQYPRFSEIPFSSETKRMTTLHVSSSGTVAYAKGAPEAILASCTHRMTGTDCIALDSAAGEAILDVARQMANDALRVLAIASKDEARIETAEKEMTFLGLAGMIDPPRPEAQRAILTCRQAGIKVQMITGDHPFTARAVARELGILKEDRVIRGAELDAMDDAELEREAEVNEVYARVSPAHKLRVVSALQNKGYVVAMTGDGVNDAPALKRADIGIAMGITGTDVSKEAAAMTLLDDNFVSIVAAVEEGRGIFENIKKYLMYLISSNIGEILLMAGAVLMGLPLPLSAVQILYVNLATDGLPALALSADPPEPDLMSRPPRNARSGIFTRPVVSLMGMGGLWSAVVNLAVFAGALSTGCPIEKAMSMTFVSLVLIQFLKAYNYRSDRHSVFRRPFANGWLNLAILWELLLLFLVMTVPALQKAFGTHSPSLMEWVLLAAVAFTVVPVIEIGKLLVRKGCFGKI
ncbi:MAG: ATPase, P-type (transporting), superfamily, subfamily [Geobacteraceae bacterium]|nr:ATPase, P-type (transporting), superfamily, subfamily [Geobacteraceae bacterium]